MTSKMISNAIISYNILMKSCFILFRTPKVVRGDFISLSFLIHY